MKSSYTAHGIIEIDGNGQLQSFFAGNSSSGNETSPYVISAFDIFVGTAMGGIFLKNIDRHLIIENNHVYNATHQGYPYYPSGIILLNATNVTIRNNDLEGNIFAIQIQNCSNINVTSNLLKNNLFFGLGINASINTIVKNNTFLDCGIYLLGSIDQCKQQYIDSTNKMNGNGTVYYYKDHVGDLPSPIQPSSEVILVNCSGTRIHNIKFSSTGIGIIIAYSKNITVTQSTFKDLTLFGISLDYSENITLSGNELQGSLYALQVAASSKVIIKENYLHNNPWDGIAFGGNSSRIEKNICANNGAYGIKVAESSNVVIEKNNATGNGYGIGTPSNGTPNNDENITVIKNIIENNKNYGFYAEDTNNINITQNNIENNNMGLFLIAVNNSIVYLNNTLYHADEMASIYPASELNNSWNTNTLGNYWGDYTTKYPVATKGKYTWNTPYVFMTDDGARSDLHPLILPVIFPIAAFKANATRAVVGQKVQFFFTGNAGYEPATMEWNFGDNTTNVVAQNPMHVYAAPGNYAVSVEVKDVNHNHDIVKVQQYISVEPDIHPFANFTYSKMHISIGETVEFHFTGVIGNAPANFAWKISNNTFTTTSLDFQYRFDQAGNISVQFTVIDYDGEHSSFTAFIEVKGPIDVYTLSFVIILGITCGVIAIATAIHRFNRKQARRRDSLLPLD